MTRRGLCSQKYAGLRKGKKMCTKGGSCSYSHHSPSAEAIARFETQRRAEVADKVARASAATVAAALPVPAWLQQARTQMIFDAAGGDALEAMRCAAAGFLGARLEKFDGLPLPDGTAAADAVATTADPNATAAPTATATPAPTTAATPSSRTAPRQCQSALRSQAARDVEEGAHAKQNVYRSLPPVFVLPGVSWGIQDVCKRYYSSPMWRHGTCERSRCLCYDLRQIASPNCSFIYTRVYIYKLAYPTVL